MAGGTLHIDLDAVIANWRSLNEMAGPNSETGAVVKANGYGLGAGRVARALQSVGVTRFFVAEATEGITLRAALGDEAEIFVFGGHMAGDTGMIRDLDLIAMLNSIEQITRHFETLPGSRFGLQLDTGMNRLGLEAEEWQAVAPMLLPKGPDLIMSHLACADEPDHPMNAHQLANFLAMTKGVNVPRSLSATGGSLLGPDYHFEVTRPGIGLYGCAPFMDAKPVTRLSLPVIQVRDVQPGETVGYGNGWTAHAPTRIATLSAGYADGIFRAFSNEVKLHAGDTPCPLRGRVSMDLITVDVTHLAEVPDALDLINAQQGPDMLADIVGTIGYEILTSLGNRYCRSYSGGGA